MFHIGIDWNPKQARLREIILNQDYFNKADDVIDVLSERGLL